MEHNILQKANDIKEALTAIRRFIHQHAETGYQEFETTAYIKRQLGDIGVETLPLKLETGLAGIIKGQKKGVGATVALRADIDALPVLEKTGQPYASQNEGAMHACGHDGHAAALLGAARLLNELKDQFAGTVLLIFQPAEEFLGGAQCMLDAGVLKGLEVDAIAALHAWPSLPVGSIGIFPGPFMASADKFEVKILGRGGHAAYPHRGADPVLAASHTIVALQDIVSREINTLEPVVLSVCTINGGKAFNTIPYEVTFGGTVRCHNESLRKTIKEKMERTIHGITSARDCGYELDYQFGVPVLFNDPETSTALAECAARVLGPDRVVSLDWPTMGSEDFSLFINEVKKGCFFRLGVGRPGEENPPGLHMDSFDFNDDALPIGAAVLTEFVLSRMNK